MVRTACSGVPATVKNTEQPQIYADNGGGNLIAAKRPAVVRQTPDYGGQATKSAKNNREWIRRRFATARQAAELRRYGRGSF
jgi:hypothetical protein